MKKLALLLSLFVLMSALCIPAFAVARDPLPTLTAYRSDDSGVVNYGPKSASQIDLPYTATNKMLHADVYASYDDSNLYFRFYSEQTIAQFGIFIKDAAGVAHTCAYSYQKINEDTDEQGWVNTSASFWGAPTEPFEAVITETDDRTLDVKVIIPEGKLTLTDGASLPVSFVVRGTEADGYSWTGNEAGDFYGGAPKHYGTLNLVNLNVNGGEDKDVMVSTKTPDANYSATVEWGAMQFVYDPAEGAKSWTATGNTVTVTNEGTRAIDVDVAYAAETNYTNITGSFDKNDVTLQPVYLVGENNNKATFTLTLSGELLNAYSAVKVGTVEVTLTPAA